LDSPYTATALLRIQQDHRYKLYIILPVHRPYENNLHHIVKDFLAGDFDYWLSFDADNPPINNPLDLVELDKDIMGLPTPVWYNVGNKKGERPVYWNAYKYVPEHDSYTEWPIREGLQKPDAVGTGCFLIARRVFENRVMQNGPFLRTVFPDGRVERGNDIAFCERARVQGFEIWTHYLYPCMHFHELELNEVVKAFRNLYE